VRIDHRHIRAHGCRKHDAAPALFVECRKVTRARGRAERLRRRAEPALRGVNPLREE
jgi:hypothetical protein